MKSKWQCHHNYHTSSGTTYLDVQKLDESEASICNLHFDGQQPEILEGLQCKSEPKEGNLHWLYSCGSQRSPLEGHREVIIAANVLLLASIP